MDLPLWLILIMLVALLALIVILLAVYLYDRRARGRSQGMKAGKPAKRDPEEAALEL